MSDERGHEQPEVLSGIPELPPACLADAVPPERRRFEVAPGELRLRHLTRSWEIAEVAHLRRQIQLPAAVLADPGFAALEKKETAAASSRHSSAVTSPWAPCGSCP